MPKWEVLKTQQGNLLGHNWEQIFRIPLKPGYKEEKGPNKQKVCQTWLVLLKDDNQALNTFSQQSEKNDFLYTLFEVSGSSGDVEVLVVSDF